MTRRRPILVWTLLLLPGLAAAAQWVRSYVRRDIVVWGSEQSGSRREVCRLYSGGGRLVFVSQSYPVPDDDAEGPVRFAHYTGDRAATAERAKEVYQQMFQSGAPSVDFGGLQYSQHFASLPSGDRLWTSLVVPWWMVTAAALTPAASAAWRKGRAAWVRRRSPGTSAEGSARQPVY
jgi:hypothetical protein